MLWEIARSWKANYVLCCQPSKLPQWSFLFWQETLKSRLFYYSMRILLICKADIRLSLENVFFLPFFWDLKNHTHLQCYFCLSWEVLFSHRLITLVSTIEIPQWSSFLSENTRIMTILWFRENILTIFEVDIPLSVEKTFFCSICQS